MNGLDSTAMSITEEHTKETLSVAYVTAVAGLAGANLGYYLHDYGVDGNIIPVKIVGKRRRQEPYHLDYQLKASTKWSVDKKSGEIVYALEAKTYNDLVDRKSDDPVMILILLCLPKDKMEWLNISSQQLKMKNCCYWAKVAGTPTSNTSSKTIRIPQQNILDEEALRGLLTEEDDRRKGVFNVT